MTEIDSGAFIESHRRRITLPDETVVEVRPIGPGDRVLLLEGFQRLSAEAKWYRFLRPMARLTEREVRYLTEIDYVNHFAWGAVTVGDPAEGVGVARYIKDEADPTVAEAAVVVADAWQRHGIGTVLLELLALSAVHNGVKAFRAYVEPGNEKAKDLLEGFGATGVLIDGLWVCDFALPTTTSPIRGTALHEALAAVAAEVS